MEELHLWTDGSRFDDKIVYNYVILTENTFIHRDIFRGRGMHGSKKAEVSAVTRGLKYINENGLSQKYSSIVVLTDFREIPDNYYAYKLGKVDLEELNPRYVWKELFEEIEKLDIPITITHFKSHQDDVNPNKLCDITCRLIKKSITQ